MPVQKLQLQQTQQQQRQQQQQQQRQQQQQQQQQQGQQHKQLQEKTPLLLDTHGGAPSSSASHLTATQQSNEPYTHGGAPSSSASHLIATQQSNEPYTIAVELELLQVRFVSQCPGFLLPTTSQGLLQLLVG